MTPFDASPSGFIETPAEVRDPFSVEAIVAWLETMPPRGQYDWDDCEGKCLIGLYGRAIGVDWQKIHSRLFLRGQLRFTHDKPHTFGAALIRLRTMLERSR